MFNDSGSFYYSPNGDLSNTQQRLEKFTFTSSCPKPGITKLRKQKRKMVTRIRDQLEVIKTKANLKKEYS